MSEANRRLYSVDALRGLVMVIMALDHVRDYFHSAAQQFQPENLERTTTAIFLTRWITHLCAPVFMFTAGMSAYFWFKRGRTRNELSLMLLKRGLWLVFLELTVLRLIFNFSYFSGPILLTVLWALGWSMVALALLSRLPIRCLAILSVLVIVLHNLADPLRLGWFWNILHRQTLIHLAGLNVIVAYPLIPWIFVMAAGFCFAPVMRLEPARRQRWLIRVGAGLTTAFLLIRGINIYGDPQPWSTGLLSFLNTTKYPPSLDFLLMTLGPGILFLAWFDRMPKPNGILLVFGRAPLFYFLAHLFLTHALTVPFALIRYGYAGFLFNPLAKYLAGYGYDLWVVYLIWIAVVALMYPLCVWWTRGFSRVPRQTV